MIKLVILIFCITSIFSFFQYSNKKKEKILLILIILLIIIAAFRKSDTVADYDEYVNIFKNTSSNIEITFSVISKIVNILFFKNVIFVFLIYAILGVSLKTKAIKELTTLWFLSLLIYISHLYILHELTQIRAGVATGFLLLCIKPLYERNLRKFLLFATCAVLFHYSALPIYFLWFFKNERINKYLYAMIIPFSYLIYFLHIDIIKIFIQFIPITYIQEKYTMYINLQNVADDSKKINVFNYVFLAKCLIFYLLLWKNNVISYQNKYTILLLKIEALSLASYIIFSIMPVFGWRFYELFGVVEIILIPMVYFVINPKIFSNLIVIFIGLCILLINIFYAKLIIF